MGKKSTAALNSAMEIERTDELVGVLTAISVVSRRLARKLALLEQRTSEKEGVRTNGKTAAVSANAT